MNHPEPLLDMRERLAAERLQVIKESSAVRRQATAALALMTLVFVIGGILVWLQFRAERSISRLDSLTEQHSSLIDQVAYRTDLVLHDEFRRSVPPEYANGLALEYQEYSIENQRLHLELADALADARSDLTRYLSSVSEPDLDELEGSAVDPRLMDTAWQSVANLATSPDEPLTDDEIALRSAITSREFSAPAAHARVLAQQMVAESRAGTTRFTLIVGLSTMTMIALVWLIALRPALVAYQDLLNALDHQANELEHNYARAAAAQHIARLGYWYKSAGSDTIECSAELAEMLTGGIDSAPATIRQLAALTSHGDADEIESGPSYQTYHRLSSETGAAELTHNVSLSGHRDATLRERVVSFPVGDSVGVTGVMLDISEIVAAQQVMLRMEKFEIIDLLISGVAHDFNNLLGIITGNAELALDPAHPEANRHLTAIIDASASAAALIGQLRQTALDPLAVAEDFIVADALQWVVSTLSPPTEVDVVLDIDPRAAAATVFANKGVFESSIVNMIKNAFEAIGSASGTVTVGMSVDSTQSGGPLNQAGDHAERAVPNVVAPSTNLNAAERIRVVVSDDGVGMSEQVVRRALQPFFTTKRDDQDHMGLGLWSVFSFAKAWEGRLEITSKADIGTQVAIVLPTAAIKATPEPRPEALDPLSDGGRVLLVEDIAELLATGEHTLRSWGFDVVTASEFETALQILNSDRELELVVTDVRLGPHASGFDLALLAIDRNPSIGVVLVSGAFSAEDIPDRLDTPRCVFVAKPFPRERLHQAISDVLRISATNPPTTRR